MNEIINIKEISEDTVKNLIDIHKDGLLIEHIFNSFNNITREMEENMINYAIKYMEENNIPYYS